MFLVLQHISVMRRGVYYVLDVVDSSGNLLTPQSLEKQLQWIIDDADKYAGIELFLFIQMILVNCISSAWKNFMQLSNIYNYQYFIFRWFDCHVCRN